MRKSPPRNARAIALRTTDADEDPIAKLPAEYREAMQAWLAKELEGKKPRTKNHDKTLSVKVDPELYTRYQHARVILDMSGQELLVEGLQMVLKKHKL